MPSVTDDRELCFTPARTLAAQMHAGERSPVTVMAAFLARIETINPQLNCFCFVYPDEAMEKAEQAEQDIRAGKQLGPAHGLPIAIKDVTPTKGKRTTRGSYMYEHWVPDHDALIVQRFAAAGAIVIGKTTTPEFAHDGFTASPLWGTTRNPWDVARTPGGSSGGSGAAVAAGCVPWAEGTDMGGSVRIPASFCGLVGLKPSLGRIPMDILPTVFDSISHFGPLTRTMSDAALFMEIAAGPDECDIQSLPDRLDFSSALTGDVAGRRLALSVDLGYYAVDPQVERTVRGAAQMLRDAGAVVEEVELGWSSEINEAWFANWGVYLDVCFTEDLDKWRNKMDPGVVALIEYGRQIDAVTLKRMEVLRTEQWHKLSAVLRGHDALLCPTMAHTAPLVGQTDSDFQTARGDGGFDGLDMTCPFNFVGQCPALSVPVGLSDGGLPIGLQIVGQRFDDLGVMRIGAAVEALLPWAGHRPKLSGDGI